MELQPTPEITGYCIGSLKWEGVNEQHYHKGSRLLPHVHTHNVHTACLVLLTSQVKKCHDRKSLTLRKPSMTYSIAHMGSYHRCVCECECVCIHHWVIPRELIGQYVNQECVLTPQHPLLPSSTRDLQQLFAVVKQT